MANMGIVNLGAQLKLTVDLQTPSYVLVPGVTTITPPPRTRASVPHPELGEDFAGRSSGQEGDSDFVFGYHWDPNDAEHTKWVTAFNNRALIGCQLVTPDVDATGTPDPRTMEFTGQVLSFEPDEWTPDSVRSATLTIIRKSDVTNS